jgi:lysyl-tRNA synthetase class 2
MPASYPNTFSRTHSSASLQREHANTPADELERANVVVAVAGRLMEKRSVGEAGLAVLQDQFGRIGVLTSREAAGNAAFAAYARWRVGDILGVTGIVCRQPDGALAVRAHDIERLVEALRPWPESEATPRYLDLVNSEATRSIFLTRSRLIAGIRAFLANTSYLEVETPILQIGVARRSGHFTTHHNALDCDLRLRSSGEVYLKRLLVGGVEKVYELNRCFHNEAAQPEFLPEGTWLEMYCSFTGYTYMMTMVEQLVSFTVERLFATTSVQRGDRTLRFERPFASIRAREAELPKLVQPTFVVDFPATQAPLARCRDNEPDIAEQFELVIDGHKVAEGRSELNDPEAVAKHDPDLARVVGYGMPPASGLSLSIDRLVMVLAGAGGLRDVILFPASAGPA